MNLVLRSTDPPPKPGQRNVGLNVLLVTGANRGIGKAIAVALATEGANLGLFGRDLARCEQVAKELRAKHAGIRIAVVPLDLEGGTAAIRPAVEQGVKELGGIDILVNCAGGAYRGRLTEIPDELWEDYFAVKPLGLIRMTREALPYLKKSKQARIINISGTRGREPGGVSVMSGPINLGTLSITKALAKNAFRTIFPVLRCAIYGVRDWPVTNLRHM